MDKILNRNFNIFPKIRLTYHNNAHIFLLLFIFLTTVFIKIVISFWFTSPFSLPDEVEYFIKASAIFNSHNIFAAIPLGGAFSGYPILLSIFFWGGNPSLAIYHSILVFNALLSSIIVFPTYFILKEFCNEKISVIGAVIIATLPSVNVYTFSVLSENLFIPLIIFSCLFFMESVKNRSKFFALALIFTLSLLVLNRPTGFLVALSFFLLLYLERFFRLSKMGKIITVALSALLCVGIVSLLLYFVVRNHGFVSGYNVGELLRETVFIMGDGAQFLHAVAFFFYQVEYLILSCYCIFFVLAGMLLLWLFRPDRVARIFHIEGTGDMDERQMGLLKALVLFVFTLSFFLMVTTSFFLLDVNASTSQPVDIYGRYVDPLVPLFVMIGIISFSFLFDHIQKSIRPVLVVTGVVLLIVVVFIFTFPFISGNNYIQVSILPIWYLLAIKNVIPMGISIAVLFIGTAFLFISGVSSQNMKTVFLVAVIVLSILINSVAIGEELSLSSLRDSQNQMGKFLSENSPENTVTAIDANSYGDMDYIWLAIFMTKGNVVSIRLTHQRNSVSAFYPTTKIGYLLTTKTLNYTADIKNSSATGGFNVYEIPG